MEILVYRVRIEIRVGPTKISRDVNIVAAIQRNGPANIRSGPAHGLRETVTAIGIYLGEKNVFSTFGLLSTATDWPISEAVPPMVFVYEYTASAWATLP
jgi:hypothetical protein